jgi:DNA primase
MANSIEDKINFLFRAFGPVMLAHDGINAGVLCPACGDQQTGKKKLTIRLDNDSHHCWVCDLRGRTLESTLKKYKPKYLQEYQERFLKKKLKIADQKAEVEETVVLPKHFKLLAIKENRTDPDVKAVYNYAASRGLSNRDIWYFKLGACSTGRFRRRLIMPSFDKNGELNYLVARTIDSENKFKYLNAKVAKKNVIFNEINVDWSQELVLVEGPMDLTKCTPNAACLLGSQFNESYALFQAIIRHSTPVLLALDSDMALKSQKIAKKLMSYGINVRVLSLNEHDDVGEMSKDEFKSAADAAQDWSDNDRLRLMISQIKSGSIF